MKQRITLEISIHFLAFAILLFVVGCSDDDQAIDQPMSPSYISEGPLFDCGNYESLNFNVDFQVNEVFEFADHFFFGGFDDLVISDGSNNEIVLMEKYKVNDFLQFESNLLICTAEGILEVNNDMNVSLKSEVGCEQLILTNSGEVLFITLGDASHSSSRIYSLDTAQGQGHVPYTNGPSNSTCISILQIEKSSNDDIWGINCSSKLLRYRDGELLDYFDESNSPIVRNDNENSMFLLAYQDDMILVSKNGSLYQILKFKDGEWLTLFELNSNITPSDQELEVRLPSLVSAEIYEDKLYIATTLASCRGFQIFDITKNEPLLPEDYSIVKDSNFESQCIDAFNISETGPIYVMVNDQLNIFNCN